MDFLEFLVDDLPFGIHYALKVFDVADSYLSVLFLRFKLEFDLENNDFRVCKFFGLLFETSIGKSLFESDSADQERIVDRSTSNFLDSDHLFIK